MNTELATLDLAKLRVPFAPSDVSWRIGQAGKKRSGEVWAKVLAYLTNRAIMDRLDEVCGPENWRNEFAAGPQGGVLCGISIRIDGEWVTKWDGAENSDIEAVKGGLSDAMKRAAVQWSIGRYLYDLGESWAEIDEKGAHYANCKIKVDGKEEWVNFRWNHPRLPSWAEPTTALPAATNPAAKPTTKPVGKPSAATEAVAKAKAESPDDVFRSAEEYCRKVSADLWQKTYTRMENAPQFDAEQKAYLYAVLSIRAREYELGEAADAGDMAYKAAILQETRPDVLAQMAGVIMHDPRPFDREKMLELLGKRELELQAEPVA